MAGEGKDTKGMEDEYKTFLAELGGKDPREMGGSGLHPMHDAFYPGSTNLPAPKIR